MKFSYKLYFYVALLQRIVILAFQQSLIFENSDSFRHSNILKRF